MEIYEVSLTSTASGSNYNLEVLVFEDGGKTAGPGEKRPSEQGRVLPTNSTHIYIYDS